MNALKKITNFAKAIANFGFHRHLLRAKAKAQRDKAEVDKDILLLEAKRDSAVKMLGRKQAKSCALQHQIDKLNACMEDIMNGK